MFSAANSCVSGYAEAFDDRNYNLFEIVLYLEKGVIELLQAGDEIRYFGTEPHPIQPGIQQLAHLRTDTGMLSQTSNMANAVEVGR